jgi:transposase InsO family protein
MKEVFRMSYEELERYRVLNGVIDKKIKQKKGAEILKLSTRQVRNLIKDLKIYGPTALISKKRGKKSNRAYQSNVKQKILRIISHNYEDYGPTLAGEKLLEKHQIRVSNETLRTWMTEAKIWVPKQRKRNKHRLRTRRECFGELIQIDGSHHDWFEGRRSKCVLIVFIDDATSKLTSLYFAEGESLEAYYNALEQHILKYGKPRGFYSDRLSVFQYREEAVTQFKYALKLLNISLITATTPQAKGRVERVNQTLQDRFIKEMRERNISTIEEANEYAKEYTEIHNKKFSKEPASTFDAHSPLETDLSRILSRYEERTLTNNSSIHFHNKTYQICEELPKKARIEVRAQRNGEIRLFFNNQELTYELYGEQCTLKEKNELIWANSNKQAKKSDHPWKDGSYKRHMKEKEIARWEAKYEKVV